MICYLLKLYYSCIIRSLLLLLSPKAFNQAPFDEIPEADLCSLPSAKCIGTARGVKFIGEYENERSNIIAHTTLRVRISEVVAAVRGKRDRESARERVRITAATL